MAGGCHFLHNPFTMSTGKVLYGKGSQPLACVFLQRVQMPFSATQRAFLHLNST